MWHQRHGGLRGLLLALAWLPWLDERQGCQILNDVNQTRLGDELHAYFGLSFVQEAMQEARSFFVLGSTLFSSLPQEYMSGASSLLSELLHLLFQGLDTELVDLYRYYYSQAASRNNNS